MSENDELAARFAPTWMALRECAAECAVLSARVAELEAALNAINRMTAAENRTLDELCRDMSYANDRARAALKDEPQ